MLFDTAEKLVSVEFLLARSSTSQDADVKDDDVAASGLDAIENVRKMVEIELVADGDEDVSGLGADGFGSELAFDLKIELIHLNVRYAGLTRALFGDGEDDVEKDGKCAAGHRGDGFGEEVDDGDEEQRERDEAEAERNLHTAHGEIERNLKIAGAGLGVAEDEDGEAIHGKRPDDTEGVEVGEEGDVAAADEDSDDLQDDDDIDDAIAGAEFRVRLAEPFAENAIFGDAV
jgi:hypothetical protein